MRRPPRDVVRTRARRVWINPLHRWQVPPRLRQLALIVVCAVAGHPWGRWRVETEDWFDYVDGPEPWAWRHCRRCNLTEQVRS